MRVPRHAYRGSFAAAAVIACAWACLRPTQITVRLSTDVPCGLVASTSIYNGTAAAPGEAPFTTTRDCTDGRPGTIGTLVVAPSSGDRDAIVTITAVAGVNTRSEDCAANSFRDCIVARRRLRYVPHEPLELPILLASACRGVVCGEDETCVPCATAPCANDAKPLCAPADKPEGCEGPDGNCRPAPSSATGSGTADGGAPLVDAASADATTASDAGDGTLRLLVPSPSEPIYGLALHGGRLYWTTNTKFWSARLLELLTNGDAGVLEPSPFGTGYRGVDVVDGGIAIAMGVKTGTCGRVFPPGRPDAAVELIGAVGGQGIAFLADSGGTQGVLATSDGLSRWSLDGGASPINPFCARAYLRAGSATPAGAATPLEGVLWAWGNTVGHIRASDAAVSVSPGCFSLAVGPPNEPLLAVGVAPSGARYVSSSTSAVFKQDPTVAEWERVPWADAGIPGAQDILVAPTATPGRIHVLVAGKDGIWIAENVNDGP